MSTLVRGNRDLIRALNRSLLLNIIRREGRISRTQLTEISGLSVGAVSGIINELLQQRWLLTTGEGDYTGGRRQTLLRLNPQAGYAIGLKVMEDRIVSAVTDFEMTVLDYRQHDFDFTDDPHALAQLLVKVVNDDIARADIGLQKFLGVGIGLAGVIYEQTGVVHYSPFFGWRDVALAQLVSQELSHPVFVENDVNTLTITEQLFGAGRRHNNFVVVTVGRGIGMGTVINGQLYSGSRGGAGEFGHTMMGRFQMGDGGVYSLEELAADPAVVASANAGAPADSQCVNLDDVVALAQNNHAGAQSALAASGEWLGIGLANVINILSPELVIISGEGVAAGDYRLVPMLAAVERYSFDSLFDDVKVVVRQTDDQAWARGAAGLVMSKIFASPVANTNVESA